MTYIILILASIAFFYFWRKHRDEQRLVFIENYSFSSVLIKRVHKQYPDLTQDEMRQVVKAMKDYFYICSQAKGKMVAMPSKIVDVFWHEFLLFTRAYQTFCTQGFGKFLHHTPTEAMTKQTLAPIGLKRAWRMACNKENINPKKPAKLPLLFHIDSSLGIKDGFIYTLNDTKVPAMPTDIKQEEYIYGGYDMTDIDCTSGCMGESGDSSGYAFGDIFGGGGEGGSCSSGCGGGD